MSCRSRLPRLRASIIDPATRTTDTVACTTSRVVRVSDERSPVVRPAPRSASIGSVLVANHAGTAPKTTPVMSASADANASTIGAGRVSIGRKVVPANASASSMRAVPTATARPAMPPATASSTLSTSACVTICRRDAPMAGRRAVCERRATARASRRFATLAQAMSSTRPHTPSRICRLRLYLLLHHADARAGGYDGDHLARHRLHDARHPVGRIA